MASLDRVLRLQDDSNQFNYPPNQANQVGPRISDLNVNDDRMMINLQNDMRDAQAKEMNL